jgi:hypothetical protein
MGGMAKEVSRRSILKSGAVTGALATGMGRVTASGNGTVELPLDVHYDEAHVLDKKWWKHVEAADRVHTKKNYIKRDGVHGQWVRPGGSDECGHPRLEVEINPDNPEAKNDIPDEEDGVPIDKVEREHDVKQFCGYQDYDYGHDLPGGAQIGPDAQIGTSTMSSKMLESDLGVPAIGTCAHSVSICEGTSSTQEMCHPDGYYNNDIGLAKSSWVVEELDFAALDVRYDHDGDGDLTYTSNPLTKIVKEGYHEPYNSEYWYDISGTYTRSAIAEICTCEPYDGGNVRKVGQTTCETYGELTAYGESAVSPNSCVSALEGQIRWGSFSDADHGDSGAPVFDNYETETWKVLGLVSGGEDTSTDGYIFGPSGYAIYERSGDRFYFSS